MVYALISLFSRATMTYRQQQLYAKLLYMYIKRKWCFHVEIK
jgi:hypothetical protein